MKACTHKMACGFLPCTFIGYSGAQLSVRNDEKTLEGQLNHILSSLYMPDEVKKPLMESFAHQHPASRLPGLADILGLCTNWLSDPSLKTNIVDNSFPFPITTMGERGESR